MNGQTDAAAVDFLAKFTDLVIWLSFQKEGAANPASTQGTSSPSDSSTEEAVWLDVARALDSYVLLAMSTSFTLSKKVRPAIDLPGNLVSIDDNTGAPPELALSAPAVGPLQDTQRSSATGEKGAKHQAPRPQPVLPGQPPPNTARVDSETAAPPSTQPNLPAGDLSSPRAHDMPAALTSTSTLEASGAEAVANQNASTGETIASPLCAIARQHDASSDLPSTPASLSALVTPVKRTFDKPLRQLKRSTSEELLQQERAPQRRFSSVPSPYILNVGGQPTTPAPLALKVAPVPLPMNRPRQFPVVEILRVKSHASSNVKFRHGPDHKEASRLAKKKALLSQQPQKKRKRLNTDATGMFALL